MPDGATPEKRAGRTTVEVPAEVLEDLGHVVRNATNLAMGHLQALAEPADDPQRQRRAAVATRALERLTRAVGVMGSAATAEPVATEVAADDLLRRATVAVGPEAQRYGVGLAADPAGLVAAPEVLADITECLLRWMIDGAASPARIVITGSESALELRLEHPAGDGGGQTSSLWLWSAARMAAGAALDLAWADDRSAARITL